MILDRVPAGRDLPNDFNVIVEIPMNGDNLDATDKLQAIAPVISEEKEVAETGEALPGK